MMSPERGARASEGAARVSAVVAITALIGLCSAVYGHGLSFIARHVFGFSAERNAVLFIVMAGSYALIALGAGRLSRWLRRWITPRAQAAALIALVAAAILLLALRPDEASLWISGIVMYAGTAVLWPLIEMYLTHGRSGPALRAAVASFNVAWMLCAALAMLGVGPAIAHHLQGGLVALAALTALAIPILWALPAAPSRHDTRAPAEVPPIYPALLFSTRLLLPLAYTFSAAMGPLLPYRMEQLGVPLEWATPATATWLIAQVVPTLVLTRVGGWAGRPEPLWLGSIVTCTGVAAVLLAPSVAVLLAGFLAFGLGKGLLYHLSLYYSQAVGEGEVEAGSTFEALIGLGQTAGPALALGASYAGGTSTLVAALGVLASLGVAGTMREIWRARRGVLTRGVAVAEATRSR